MSDAPVFDATVPAQLQDSAYDCSQESADYMLRGWSRTPSDSWMTQSWIDEGVMTPQYGLMDATGAGMRDWLNRWYGMDGMWSENVASVTFDDLAAEVAVPDHGVCAGGRAFYHWVGIRSVDPSSGALAICNSAPGYMGVYSTLTRSQFTALGPWSMVRLRWDHTPPVAVDYPRGVDVASWQGNPIWSQVAEGGYMFAWTKCSESVDYLNPTFARNWHEIAAAGLVRGAYHFARPDANSPEDEADYFLAMLHANGELLGGDLLALDLEDGSGDLSGWAQRFVLAVEQNIGTRPLIYTNASFAAEHGLANVAALGECGLWLAAWQDVPPAAPPPWRVVTFWQNTDSASVPGIAGPCDGDLALGELAAIVEQYGVGGTGPVSDQPSYDTLGTLVGVAYHDDGTVIPALEAAITHEDIETVRAEVQNVVNFLRANNPHA